VLAEQKASRYERVKDPVVAGRLPKADHPLLGVEAR
jgi:hypothetical protein